MTNENGSLMEREKKTEQRTRFFRERTWQARGRRIQRKDGEEVERGEFKGRGRGESTENYLLLK